MSDGEVQIRIVGDASKVAPAVDQAKQAVSALDLVIEAAAAEFRKGFDSDFREICAKDARATKMIADGVVDIDQVIEQTVSDFRRGFAQEIPAAMERAAAATNRTEQELRELGLQSDRTGRKLREDSSSAGAGFEKLAGHLRNALVGYLAFLSVGSIKSWAESVGDAAEATQNLTQQLGLSVKTVQLLKANAETAGIPFEKLAGGLAILDRKLATEPELFAKLGIEIPKNADQVTALNAVMEKFATTADGPQKTALAMALMGRSGAELIPILNQGSAGLAEFTKQANEYGVVNEAAVEAGAKLDEAFDANKLAIAGLTNTLTEAFAPLLVEMVDGFNNLVKSMTESYEAGGVVKIAFDNITAVMDGFGQIIDASGSALSQMFSNSGAEAVDWGTVFQTVIDAIVTVVKAAIYVFVAMEQAIAQAIHAVIGTLLEWYANTKEVFANVGLGLEVAGREFSLFGKIAYDALALKWNSIAADWSVGMAEIDDVVRRRGAQIVADAKAIHDQAAGQLREAANIGKDFNSWSDAFWGPAPKQKSTGIAAPKTGGLASADVSGLAKGGPKADKSDTLVQQLDDVLTAKKLAWSKEQDAQGTAIAFSLQAEADYWAKVLERTDLSTKQRAAIDSKYLTAHSQVLRQQWQIEEDSYRAQVVEADKNASAKLVLAQTHLARVRQMFGEESREFAQAQAEIVRIKREAERQIEAIERLRAERADDIALDEIDNAEKVAQHAVTMGQSTDLKLLALERQFENQRYGIAQAAALRTRNLIDPSRDPVAYAQANVRIEQLERQHQTRLTQIDQQAQLQRTAVQRRSITQIGDLFGQNISKMLTLQQSFADTVAGLWNGLVGIVANVVGEMVSSWIAQQLTALIFGKTSRASEVVGHAGVAGAAAFASTAAIPIVGPALAPAAAAAAVAGALSFLPLASAEGGDWSVRAGLYNLHEDEMVLPAWAAAGVRDMIGQGGGGRSPVASPDSSGGDQIHMHFNGPTNRREIERWIADHSAGVAQGVRRAARANMQS